MSSARTLPGAPIQLVIFDLMGTLITDDGVVKRAYEAALVQAGLKVGESEFVRALVQVEDLRGRPTLVVLSEVLGDPVLSLIHI